MKKIVLFCSALPDVIADAMRDKKLNRFSPELIEMIESARTITNEEANDNKVMDELKRTGELFRLERSGLVYGYTADFKIFSNVYVREYDESHRHMIDEYDGDESLIDLDNIEPESGTPEEYNLWQWKRS